MKKLVRILFSAAALFACVSCAKESAQSVIIPDDGQIRFKSNLLTATTKVTPVTSLSSFNVYCYQNEDDHDEVFNVNFSGSSVYSGSPTPQYWPAEDMSYGFYASNDDILIGDGEELTEGEVYLKVDGTTDVVVAICDAATYKTTNTLNFKHIYARLGSVTVNAPSDGSVVSNLEISINVHSGGVYTLSHDDWDDYEGFSNETIATSTGVNAATDLYIAPEDCEIFASYTLTKGSYSKEYNKEASIDFPQGKISSITITLPDIDGAEEIKFNVSITDWTTNNITIPTGSWSNSGGE